MTQRLFQVEKGLRISGANSDSPSVDHLFGSAAPGGDVGDQDAAGLGSLYHRTNGSLYVKIGTSNVLADWTLVPTFADILALSWRSERVIVATGDVAPSTGTVIDLVATPFGDDAVPKVVAADFVIGDYIIFGVGGTETLMRVSLVAGDEITVVDADDPLTDNDTFVVRMYLPDGVDAQEKQAIVTYNGTTLVKISDFNWALADGINLTSGYVGNGTNALPAASDTVEAAISKLDANQRDQVTLSGVANGAVDNGTFTGYTIPDSQTTKQALQALETALEARSQAAAVTTITTLDSVIVDNVLAAEWEIHMREDATPANVKVEKVMAIHNGTAAADATVVDSTAFAKLSLGSNFNFAVTVDLNGAAGSQVMRLRVASTSGGVTFTARRVDIR